MEQLTTIDVSKEDFKFSAAHFTIFSATERERLHGHNYKVRAQLVAAVDENGLCFNYQEIKTRLRKSCHALDEYMLLPAYSPYLQVDRSDHSYQVSFNNETFTFLASDTQLLPIRNTTIEEFSHYLLKQLIETDDFLSANAVRRCSVSVSSGDGQWATADWQASA
jgi:6-pyruvoyltetrahydropterin/6-carboxytetrahydropterin synthase